jgi:hypothetical protein
VAQEELAQEATQDVCVGAGMEETSRYVPTAERMGSTTLTTDSCYQRKCKKPANFIDGKFVYEKKVK